MNTKNTPETKQEPYCPAPERRLLISHESVIHAHRDGDGIDATHYCFHEGECEHNHALTNPEQARLGLCRQKGEIKARALDDKAEEE